MRPEEERDDASVVIRVDRARCVGAAQCMGVAPEHFALDGELKARPQRATTALSASLAEAAVLCPVEAISIMRKTTGQLVAPLE